ncbi:protein FAR1-RELATED SEQUENCE 7-like [Silene latifolia]|uniref:protein FAR1-RELATED SEQUENCE 7-like n=1 Tax=Silene latifolia TaxID=37657 RepID=UPI003D773FF9
MPNIFRRVFGSNSNASQYDREDEEVEDEEDPDPPSRRQEDMQTHVRSIDAGYDPVPEWQSRGQEATPHKLFTKTKKNTKGEWINPRAAEIDLNRMDEDSLKQNGVQPDRQELCREVEKRFTPYIGLGFGGVEDAVTFYKIYAIACGFDVRRYTTKKWRGGEIKSKLVVCNREGFAHKTPNKDRDDGLVGENSQRIFRLKIGATKTYRICKEQVNRFENIGASLNNFKNFHRDVKCFIHERDGQLFVDHFKEMTETRIGFYFDYDLDDDGSLRRAIWADGVDHHKRSVTFCGALIAREDYESFNWVFSRFLQAMGGKEPEYIITDQDPGIIKSVPLVFKTARHRFCMWHIMNKMPSKFDVSRSDYNDFMCKINDIIWDDELEASEFDGIWEQIIEDHGVGVNDWFADTYAIRGQWVMAHCRDLRMASIMRTTQRSES